MPYLVEASTKELGAASLKVTKIGNCPEIGPVRKVCIDRLVIVDMQLLRRGCPPLEVHPENGTKEAPNLAFVSKPPLSTARNTKAQTFAEAFRGFPLVMRHMMMVCIVRANSNQQLYLIVRPSPDHGTDMLLCREKERLAFVCRI